MLESSLHLLLSSHQRKPRNNLLQVAELGSGALEVVVLATDVSLILVEKYGLVWSLPTGVVLGSETEVQAVLRVLGAVSGGDRLRFHSATCGPCWIVVIVGGGHVRGGGQGRRKWTVD